MSKSTLQGIRKAQEREILPSVDLYPQVEYAGRKIDACAFGPGSYDVNVASMRKRYFHSDDLPYVTFKPLSTAESLAVASHNFANLAKPNIFNPNWLQAGRIVMAREGVWINPLRDSEENIIIDNKELERHLKGVKEINGIYLLDGDTSFVPYVSFRQGLQKHGEFLKGGLARGLVHTSDRKADILSTIANDVEYPKQVDVFGFDSVKEPIVRVVSLVSARGFVGDRLYVSGDCWCDSNDGYTFGGLVSGEASAQKTK